MITENKHSMKMTARSLRSSMTKEERRLYYRFLKKLPVTFNRQKQLCNYIVDFYCAKARLVIELDGSQHYTDEGRRKDAERDQTLGSRGILVLRYSNYDLNTNFDGVCLDILNRVNERAGFKIVQDPDGYRIV